MVGVEKTQSGVKSNQKSKSNLHSQLKKVKNNALDFTQIKIFVLERAAPTGHFNKK
jgi:hypothetical protein